MVKILRNAGLSELIAGDEVERLAQGFQFTEGPLWCPDGTLLFQDIKAERTYRIAADRSVHVVRERTGAANGQTFMPGGAIAFCEQNGRRVSRMSRDGSGVEPLCETWSGQCLNSPNDIVCRTDGRLYFTDPPYGVAPRDRALHFQGVYSLDPSAAGPAAMRLLADDFEKPNGLAFSPSEEILYVCDTARYHVRSFLVEAGGTLRIGTGRVWARLDPARAGRTGRAENRLRRPGLRRRRRRGLGLRALGASPGDPGLAGPPLQPGLGRCRWPRPGNHRGRRRLPRAPSCTGRGAAVFAMIVRRQQARNSRCPRIQQRGWLRCIQERLADFPMSEPPRPMETGDHKASLTFAPGAAPDASETISTMAGNGRLAALDAGAA